MDFGDDDSDLPMPMVIDAVVHGMTPVGFSTCPGGGLMSTADAESLDKVLLGCRGL